MVLGGGVNLPIRSDYIKIQTVDEHYFYIRKEYGNTQTFSLMMRDAPEDRVDKVTVPGNSLITQSVCRFLAYKHRYVNTPPDIPIFTVPPEYLIDLMTLADFMKC
ncbi:hypothetical protein NPIL_555451 [Nephila pilipes]|uniref:Elongin-C n=1 Tax=Nephila pilipes TaxID=299642 RepID=A0A8X6TTH4_NEPPI|nr:hypothetical protein NPIL_555451 [Nephila pilipes]